MAVIIQDGKVVNPQKVPEGTRWDPRRGSYYGWANKEGQGKNAFIGFSPENTVEVRDRRWTLVSREREG